MAIETYVSVIILNVKRLNAPIKRHRLTEWMQNKTNIYAVYNKLSLDLRTYID